MKNFPTHSTTSTTISRERQQREREGGRWAERDSCPVWNPFCPVRAALISFSCQRAMQTACTDWRPTEFFPYSEGASPSQLPSSSYPSAHLPISSALPFCPSLLCPSPCLLLTLCHFGSQRNAPSYVCNVVRLLAAEDAPPPLLSSLLLLPLLPLLSLCCEITLINFRLIFIFISYFSQIFVQRKICVILRIYERRR